MTYVISDLHGGYRSFLDLLEQIGFGDGDVMYILGDLVDYGEESMDLISDLSLRLNVYSIAGEHDYTAVRMLSGFDKMLRSGAAPSPEYITEMTQWVQNGGQSTLNGFRALDEEEREGILDYLGDLALFEELEVNGKNYLLVHAGIAGYREDRELDGYLPEDFFSEPLDADYPLMEGTTIIVGHAPTKSGKITYGKGSIFMDCGMANDGRLGCLCLETGEEYYV